jgi:putative aldouronate transport system substrate-binding protein
MELVGSGKIGMQYGAMWNSLYPALQAPRDSNPAADWDCYAIPTVSDKPSVVPLSIPTYNYFAVNKDCKNPEAMFKILNLDCSPETMNNSELQSNPEFDSVWKYAFIGTSSPNQNIIQTREVAEALKTGDTSKFSMPASEKQTYESLLKYTKGTEADKKDNSNWGMYKVFGENGSQTILGKYLDENRLLYNIFYGAPTTTMTAKKASLDKIEIEAFTKIIMGKSPIDDFDKFVSDYKKLGGDDITKEVNDWYASK